MSQNRDELTVLRNIWAARGQSGADIGAGRTKVCKNMKNIGFAGITGDPVDGSTARPVDEDQRAAWRERLASEGKIVPGAQSVRELLHTDDADRSAARGDGPA